MESYKGVMPVSALMIKSKVVVRSGKDLGLARLKGAKIGATRAYACGEGGKPPPMQESPCGSSG
ncbi:MAG: hypothetical protein Q9N26_01835 [Aquificota bacterium]|nr:hypothetical protein [Aquificota bacterium]